MTKQIRINKPADPFAPEISRRLEAMRAKANVSKREDHGRSAIMVIAAKLKRLATTGKV